MVIELPLHQPETTQHHGLLPPATQTPNFWEDPAQQCCSPRDAPCTACTPRAQVFPLYPCKPITACPAESLNKAGRSWLSQQHPCIPVGTCPACADNPEVALKPFFSSLLVQQMHREHDA